MKYRQVFEYIKSYIDRFSEEKDKQEKQKRSAVCETCTGKELELDEIISLIENDSPIKAPDGFTERIMSSVSAIKVDTGQRNDVDYIREYRLFFRRIGVSMVLTAGIMLISICFQPARYLTFTGLHDEDIKTAAQVTSKMELTVDEFNYRIKSVFKYFKNLN